MFRDIGFLLDGSFKDWRAIRLIQLRVKMSSEIRSVSPCDLPGVDVSFYAMPNFMVLMCLAYWGRPMRRSRSWKRGSWRRGSNRRFGTFIYVSSGSRSS